MKKTLVVMVLLLGAMAMFVGFDQLVDASEQKKLTNAQITTKISDEWKASGKQFLAGINYSARAGTGCTRCHDGYVFANQPANDAVPAIADANPMRPHIIGIDCQACHTGLGKELMHAGGLETEFMGYIDGLGKGATCVYCHDLRYDTPEDKLANFKAGNRVRTPHYSSAIELVGGLGGMRYDDASYPTGTHGNLKDSCVTCHMPETNDNYASHEFGVKKNGMDAAMLQSACGSCHIGIDRNYVDSFKDEIKVLAYKVKDAVEADFPEGYTIDDIFANPSIPELLEQMTEEQMIGAYNYKLVAGGRSDTVKYDGTYGVHNPPYAKALLNESLKRLTAE